MINYPFLLFAGFVLINYINVFTYFIIYILFLKALITRISLSLESNVRSHRCKNNEKCPFDCIDGKSPIRKSDHRPPSPPLIGDVPRLIAAASGNRATRSARAFPRILC